ncbi:MAG TPA: hypothetical protein PLI09_24660 [Candidatus Hydrogenedentes bacterium]|nr:hypothetical protein [Candidatus Hydrogenedentota bacterium]
MNTVRYLMMAKVGLLPVLIWLLISLSCVSQNQDISAKASNEKNAEQSAKERIENTLARLDIKHDDIISDEITKQHNNWVHEKPVRVIETKTYEYIFDCETGTIFSCMRKLPEEEFNQEVAVADIISKEKAIEIATEFAEKLDVPCPEFSIYCHGCDEDSNVLAIVEWDISGRYTYKNIPYFWSLLHIDVSGGKGLVNSLMYWPIPGYPKSIEALISEEEAAKKAKEFCSARHQMEQKIRKSEKMIICRNEPRVCWVFWFDSSSEVISVDATTGDVVLEKY